MIAVSLYQRKIWIKELSQRLKFEVIFKVKKESPSQLIPTNSCLNYALFFR